MPYRTGRKYGAALAVSLSTKLSTSLGRIGMIRPSANMSSRMVTKMNATAKFFSSRRASSRVPMPATFIPPARLRASLTSSVGTRNSFAPARRAVTAFCGAPPMGPTLPSAWIVPVTATFLPPVRSPGVSSSRIVRVNASPADGPLTRPVSIATFTGKSNFSLRVEVEMPTWARPWQPPCAAARLTTVTGMLLPRDPR